MYTALHFDRILSRGYHLDPSTCPAFWAKVVKFIQLSLRYKIRGVVIHEPNDPEPARGEPCISTNDLSLLVRLVYRLDPCGRDFMLQLLLNQPTASPGVDIEALYVRMMRARFGDYESRDELRFQLLLLLAKERVPIHM